MLTRWWTGSLTCEFEGQRRAGRSTLGTCQPDRQPRSRGRWRRKKARSLSEALLPSFTSQDALFLCCRVAFLAGELCMCKHVRVLACSIEDCLHFLIKRGSLYRRGTGQAPCVPKRVALRFAHAPPVLSRRIDGIIEAPQPDVLQWRGQATAWLLCASPPPGKCASATIWRGVTTLGGRVLRDAVEI